jgi:hypothetical protein
MRETQNRIIYDQSVCQRVSMSVLAVISGIVLEWERHTLLWHAQKDTTRKSVRLFTSQ